jgi:hypothetical protein
MEGGILTNFLIERVYCSQQAALFFWAVYPFRLPVNGFFPMAEIKPLFRRPLPLRCHLF